MCNFKKTVKRSLFYLSLLGAIVLAKMSYGQNIEYLSAVRDIPSGGQVNEQVLDLTISLHRSWSEIASNPLLKNAYEQTIRYWADGVYEMTNGGHKLGRIRIFTDGHFFCDADVQWDVDLHPQASINGFNWPLAPGRRLYMADYFDEYDIRRGQDIDLQGAGYTLAHESGHYIYSLFDEYELQSGDVSVEPSVMNNQWEARGGDYEWLNFSTSYNIGGLTKTNQGRMHGADAWTVLTRNPAYDLDTVKNSSGRCQYPVLNTRKPLASDMYIGNNGTNYTWMRVELNNPANRARDSLQVVWMSDTIFIDMVLDISGSMNPINQTDGIPLNKMKAAATAFVDIINTYSKNLPFVPAIGLTTFSSSVRDAYSVTALNDNNVTQIKDTINALIAGGYTAMFDACTTSVNKLISNSQINSNRLTMLFTDGEENYSNETDVANVIKQFVKNNIPIYTFGYGSGVGHYNCKDLSAGTNGRFFSSLTDFSKIKDAWVDIFGNMADLQYVNNTTTFSVDTGFTFTIDPTVHSVIIDIRLSVDSTNAGTVGVPIVYDGIGARITPTGESVTPMSDFGLYPLELAFVLTIDSNEVAKAALGQWKCRVDDFPSLVSNSLRGTVRVTAKSDAAYTAAVGNHQSGFYTWPQPLHLSASSSGRGGIITGLGVAATLTSPSGIVTNVLLNDNGVNGDKIKGDGIYSLDYPHYPENGQYTLSVQFDNNSSNAYYAIEGISRSLPRSGVMVPIDTVFVTENFVRSRNTVLHVTGVNAPPPTRTGSIMGFDNDTLWSIINSSGTLSSSTIRTEGIASLQISGNGWQQIKSLDINTDELQDVTNTLSIDLFMGNTQTNPYWTGQVQLFVNCPSANIYNQHIGFVNLTDLPLDMFSTLSFTLPQSILDIMSGSYSDFSFSLSINTNANTGEYYIDNMRFGN